MSTQRRIRRSNEKLKTKQVETTVEKRPKLAQRIISAVTAMGIFANPLVASAQIISGAEFTNVTTNGSVIDIETKKNHRQNRRQCFSAIWLECQSDRQHVFW